MACLPRRPLAGHARQPTLAWSCHPPRRELRIKYHKQRSRPGHFHFSIFHLQLSSRRRANTEPTRENSRRSRSDLKEFVETPSVSGYEQELTEKIRAKLASFHPVVDNLGDVIVTIGSGAPHRLIVTPIDEPGFVVSGITDDGYLRLQRLPQSGLPPIFNALYSAQPVKIRTASGKWIDGVVAGISVHLHHTDETTPSASDIENMYVDIGATSAAEARAAGVNILSPVAINRHLGFMTTAEMAARRSAINSGPRR